MKTCPICRGTVIIADMNNFCYRCGSKLVSLVPRYCVCGEELSAVDQFCSNCGKKVENAITDANKV